MRKILKISKKHWVVYGRAILFLIVGIALISLEYILVNSEPVMIITGVARWAR